MQRSLTLPALKPLSYMFAPPCRVSLEDSLSFDGPPDSRVVVGGRTYLYFAGNSYYALQSHPEVLAAACESILKYGIGAGTARIAFTPPPIFEVQRKTATYMGTDYAFYCSSGYLAAQILMETLQDTFERVFIDEAAHTSLFNAVKVLRGLASAPVLFAHGSAEDLKLQIDRTLRPGQRPMVLTDGVFSSLGDIAPLPDYDAVLRHYDGAGIFVDDSHGFGILGQNGRGTLEYFRFPVQNANKTAQDSYSSKNAAQSPADLSFGDDLEQKIEEQIFFPQKKQGDSSPIPHNTPVHYYYSAAMSKAIGGFGGILPGSETFVQRIFERSRIIYGSSPPPSPIASATAKGLDLVFAEPELRNSLRSNTAYLKSKLGQLGIKVDSSDVPIIVFQLGSAHNMRRIQRTLSQQGILIAYLPRSPGIGPDGALRIAVFATHNHEMLNHLVNALKKLI